MCVTAHREAARRTHNAQMPANEAVVHELGLRYSAAFWVYMRRVRMVGRVSIAGPPSVKFLEKEAKALRELIHARESFLQAALSHSPFSTTSAQVV